MSETAIHENKQVVADFFTALNAGLNAPDRSAAEEWARYLAADMVDHNKIIFGEGDEPGAAVEGFRQQLAAFSDGDGAGGLFVQDLIGEGGRVVARLNVRGTHTGYHPRMPEPTGRDCDVEQIWIFTVADRKITEIRAVSDRLGMFMQLGWAWPTAD